MTWKPEKRTELHKTFGDYRLIPERNEKSETAHLVDLGDRKVRVLPDADSTGQKRAVVVRRALEQIAALDGVSGDVAETYLVGAISREHLSWEYVEDNLPVFGKCTHRGQRLETVGGLDIRDGRGPHAAGITMAYATVVCPDCGQKWWGTVEPLATDEEIERWKGES